ncbi:MAG: hypothetical protein AAF989_08540 [Planctomycetota bacterium]
MLHLLLRDPGPAALPKLTSKRRNTVSGTGMSDDQGRVIAPTTSRAL